MITTNNKHGMAEQRRLFVELMNQELDFPVISKRSYSEIDSETFQLYAATDLGFVC